MGRVLSDGGGTYTWVEGPSPGSIIRSNVIHDMFPDEKTLCPGWGVYLDGQSNHVTVEDNLCYNYQGGLTLNELNHKAAFGDTTRNSFFARRAPRW